ncbi:LADA_0H01904g1_1 [Lachancea dasiensis]|uniref:LADA_0H01904g1_1 n=1 Tax=Lachancea dasiensis TaxID=1072105 RepID=A0A1G4JZI7_9SACH|nr:LADA_0H01904g1_1 [Lachancea dasiensis]
MKLGQLSPTKNLLAPPKTFQKSEDNNGPRSRSSSFSRIFSSSDSSPRARSVPPPEEISTSAIPPELAPIVTLLSAQAHRRYHEGIFLILKDLNSDGSPAARTWKEVYGVLIGTQLALWDARVLAENGDRPEELMRATSKPTYINFTDASFRPLDPKEAVIADGKKQLKNTIVVSTTLKNRYFLQFSDKEAFAQWHASFRLSAFEFTSLQEAYTGAFLSSKGAKLGDIRVILADTKFDYEDWVSVRFGAGMPWKRCYAVISQPLKKSKSKRICGEINFFENDKKTKKVQAMTTVKDASAIYALYPSSPVLIDTSTMIKLEGHVAFGKKDTPTPTDIFIMPEKHHAVPGYDTIIRFLIPAMNAFQLYGRPKRLIADRHDLNSLLFGLPTLPRVHFLQKEDILSFAGSQSNMTWSVLEWRSAIKNVLLKKIGQGYTGCGSSEGLNGALASPAIGSNELFDSSPIQTSPLLASVSRFPSENNASKASLRNASSSNNPRAYHQAQDNFSMKSDYEYQSGARDEPQPSGLSISQKSTGVRATPTIDIQHSNFDGVENAANEYAVGDVSRSRKSELSNIYDKYSQVPFGTSAEVAPPTMFDDEDRNSVGAYDDYMGSPKVKNLDISNLRDSNSTDQTEISHALNGQATAGRRSNRSSYNSESRNSYTPEPANNDVLQDFYSLSQQISKVGLENRQSDEVKTLTKARGDDFNFEVTGTGSSSLDNVFDPDYLEQNQMLDDESHYTANESKFHYSSENLSQRSISGSDTVPFSSQQPTGYGQPQIMPKQRKAQQIVTPNAQTFSQSQLSLPGGPTSNSAENAMRLKHSPVYSDLNAVGTGDAHSSPLHSKNQPAGAYGGPFRAAAPRGQHIGMQHKPLGHQMPAAPQMGPGPRAYSPAQPSGMPNPYHRPVPLGTGPPPAVSYPINRRASPGYRSAPQKPLHIPAPNYQPAPGQSKSQAQKPRSPMTGGFSQFMPATANNPNPYSANPYQQQ